MLIDLLFLILDILAILRIIKDRECVGSAELAHLPASQVHKATAHLAIRGGFLVTSFDCTIQSVSARGS